MRFIALRAAEMHEHRELNAISPAVPNPNTKINFYYWPAFKSDIFVSRNTSQGHEYENKFLIPHNYYFKRQNVITVIIKFFIYA